ncbi:MAG: sn-glycerol-3-phosphate ABC transporter ATP-binding protein UgpC [Planctomycetes bacterium]|nr:sn-glycerol-3-phosphate ABC transporter ATP-binding protein UgpC [Planctomycetota bacterium]
MATIDLNGVGKTYPGGVQAVRGADLRIGHGEFVVLVGPSGCGKSTLLRMIAGLETITAGTLAIDGSVVNDVPPQDRDIAMVFQNYALYPHMDVRTNMAFGLLRRRKFASRLRALLSPAYASGRTHERAEIDRRVLQAARVLGIEHLLQRKPAALSGGQRQRVAVGRAMVREPKVFLFDEPLSNLDAKLRVEMRAELRMLHRRLGATMIYVTHDQEEAMSLGDRVVVLKDGLIQQAATPRQVYDRPANRFVAEFVGTPTMNMVEGTLEARGTGMVFRGQGIVIEGRVDAWRSLIEPRPRPVVLGIRPEHVQIGGGTGLQATVEAVEHYGDRMDVQLRCGDRSVTARCLPQPLQEGGMVNLTVDLARTHLFEPGNAGLRLGE